MKTQLFIHFDQHVRILLIFMFNILVISASDAKPLPNIIIMLMDDVGINFLIIIYCTYAIVKLKILC